jgi:hypothetical protein
MAPSNINMPTMQHDKYFSMDHLEEIQKLLRVIEEKLGPVLVQSLPQPNNSAEADTPLAAKIIFIEDITRDLCQRINL